MGEREAMQAEDRACVKALGKKEQGAPWNREDTKVARAKKTCGRVK